VLALTPEVIQDLQVLHARRAAQLGRDPSGAHQVYNVTLCYRRYKGPEITDPQVTGCLRRLSEPLGERISAHRLRRTLATALAEHGNYRPLQ